MTLFFFLCFSALIFSNLNSIGQELKIFNSFKVLLNEEISNHTKIKLIDNQLVLIDYNNQRIYDIKGDSLIPKIDFTCMVDTLYDYTFEIIGFVQSDSLMGIIASSGRSIYYFDESGNYVKKIRLTKKRNSNSVYIDRYWAFKYFTFADSKNLFLPTSADWHYYRKSGNYNWRTKRFYRKKYLLGHFNEDGIILNKFGRYNKIYRRNKVISYLGGMPYFVDYTNSRVFLGQEATSEIEVFDFNGNQLNSFGEPLPELDTFKLKTIKNQYMAASVWYSYKVESYEYSNIFYDKTHNLLFRKCRLPDRDTTEIDYSRYRSLRFDHACIGPDPNYETRKKIIEDCQVVIQVYNDSYELIKEFRPEGRFDILGMDGEHLLVLKDYSPKGRYYQVNRYVIE
jgi:hypothetical protein